MIVTAVTFATFLRLLRDDVGRRNEVRRGMRVETELLLFGRVGLLDDCILQCARRDLINVEALVRKCAITDVVAALHLFRVVRLELG